jgi:hypothetical protein
VPQIVPPEILDAGARERCIPGLGADLRDRLAQKALPMVPDELSMFWRAGDTFCRNNTASSAARIASFRLADLISAMASLIRVIAGSERQPKAPMRKRGANDEECFSTVLPIALTVRVKNLQFQRFAVEDTRIDHPM